MLPSFIVIGGMRCGTSSMYHYLSEHPEICMSSMKETDFFVRKTNYWRGLEWYRARFDGEAKAYGEASPNYTKRHSHPGVPECMHAIVPDVKLIYIVRNPLARIVSHYVYTYHRGYESRSLPEVLASLHESDCVLTSMYYFQLSAYLEHFPADRILVITSERFKMYRKDVMRQVFDFIGVDPSFESRAFEKIHHTSMGKLGKVVLRSLLSSVLNVRPIHFGRPSLDRRMKARLRDYLAPDVEKLRSFTGLGLEEWPL